MEPRASGLRTTRSSPEMTNSTVWWLEPPISEDPSEPAERANEATAPIPLTMEVNEESAALHEGDPSSTSHIGTVPSRPLVGY